MLIRPPRLLLFHAALAPLTRVADPPTVTGYLEPPLPPPPLPPLPLRTTPSRNHGGHQEEDADAEAGQGECYGPSRTGGGGQEGS